MGFVQDLGDRRVMQLRGGDDVIIRFVVVEADTRCVVSYVSQHVVVLWPIVKPIMPMFPILSMLTGLLVGGDTIFDGLGMNTMFLPSTTLCVVAL